MPTMVRKSSQAAFDGAAMAEVNSPNNSSKTQGSTQDLQAVNRILNMTTTELNIEDEGTTGNTKAERNRRKKENAKKAKAEAKAKEQEEKQLLKEMAALSLQKANKMHEHGDKTRLGEKRSLDQAKMSVETLRNDIQAVSQSSLSSEEDLLAAKGVGAGGLLSQVHVPVSPPESLFTFKSCPEKGGVGAYARDDIKKGTDILVEEAIMRGSVEFICKEALFKVLSKDKQNRIKALHSRCNCKSTPCVETTLMKVWDVNSYLTAAGPMLYELAARFNHDCLPHLARSFTKEDYIVFRAARDIKKGEELVVNYILTSGSSKAKRKVLLDKFGFICKCRGCMNNRIYTASDVLRGTLPERVATKAPLVGRYKSEEIAAYNEVEEWFKDINATMIKIQENFYKYLKINAFVRNDCVADSNCRGLIAEKALMTIEKYLKQNNKFGLDDTFFESYRARNIPKLLDTTEKNFAQILKELEKFSKKEGISN